MRRALAVLSALLILAPRALAQHEQHRAHADSARVKLDAVTVQAERVAVELRSGATVVHVRESAAAGGSIADLLRTVPGLELDADGRITMRGQAGVLVLANGRRLTLTGEALAAFLRQMPASALDRVEAGTIASARAGAEGAAGVVNLVFPGGDARTAMRSVSGSMGADDHYMASAAAADGGDALRWDAAYSVSGMRPRTDMTSARWSQVPGDPALHTDQRSRAREGHRLHAVQAGATLAPWRSGTVALRGEYSWMAGTYHNGSALQYVNANGDTDSARTASLIEHDIPSGRVGIVARAGSGATRFTSEVTLGGVDEELRGGYDDVDAGYRYMSNAMRSRLRDGALRNDLFARFNGFDVALGHESRRRTIDARHERTHFSADTVQGYRYELDVHAGYLSLRRAVRGVRADAGVRVEGDRTSMRLDTAVSRTALRAFPTIRGEWTDVRRSLVWRLAYGRRITRPDAAMLNPFSMGGDDMNEIVGNPSLLPEVADQVELGVERHGRGTLQLTPFIRWTRDPIRQLKAPNDRGGAVTTMRNLGAVRTLGADGSMRASPTDGATVILAGTVAHDESSGPYGYDGVYASARLTVDVRLAERTTAQLYAWRRSAQAIEQGEIQPAFTTELALTQRLARDRARVTLRLNDPFRGDRLRFRIEDATFSQESRRRIARPLFSLFASYAVGGAPRDDGSVRPEPAARIF